MKRINIPRDPAAHNSRLIRRPIQRMVWLFLLPTFAAFCIGFLYPFFKGAFLSFCKFKLTSQWTWVGFSNYIKAFSDSSFLHAFWYTALFAFVSVVFINVLAFTVAYFLTKGIRGSNLFRTVFFMPNLIGGIVLGYIWSMIFDGFLVKYNTSVVLNSTFGFWGLIILICWQQVGYMMIIYIAGLQSIPEDMLEAARTLKEHGYTLYATGGTSRYLTENGIENNLVYWPSEQREPQALTLLHERKIDMVVNIPKDLTAGELSNGYKIRRAAVDLNIPLITNSRLASAFIQAFCHLDVNELPIKSWDEYK